MTESADAGGHGAPRTPVHFKSGGLRRKLLRSFLGLTLFGLVLLLFGFRAMRWLWFPLAYLAVFGQTISDRLMNIVTFEMQDITARGSHLLLIVLGLDVDRLGNTLSLFDEGAAPPRWPTDCSRHSLRTRLCLMNRFRALYTFSGKEAFGCDGTNSRRRNSG